MENKQINHFMSQVAYSKVPALTKKDLRIAVSALEEKKKEREGEKERKKKKPHPQKPPKQNQKECNL